jgi:hypothetical protein
MSTASKITNDGTEHEKFNYAESSTTSAAQYNLLSRSAISLYALRYANPDEDWKIQVLFGNHIKFDFTTDRILTCQEVSSLCLLRGKIVVCD